MSNSEKLARVIVKDSEFYITNDDVVSFLEKNFSTTDKVKDILSKKEFQNVNLSGTYEVDIIYDDNDQRLILAATGITKQVFKDYVTAIFDTDSNVHAKFYNMHPTQVEGFKLWMASRPQSVQDLYNKYKLDHQHVYVRKSTGHRVFIVGYTEEGDVIIGLTHELNNDTNKSTIVMFDRTTYCDPADLVPCYDTDIVPVEGEEINPQEEHEKFLKEEKEQNDSK